MTSLSPVQHGTPHAALLRLHAPNGTPPRIDEPGPTPPGPDRPPARPYPSPDVHEPPSPHPSPPVEEPPVSPGVVGPAIATTTKAPQCSQYLLLIDAATRRSALPFRQFPCAAFR